VAEVELEEEELVGGLPSGAAVDEYGLVRCDLELATSC